MALNKMEFDTVGTLFYKITSPLNKELDPNMVKTLCEKIDIEPNGHLVAIRLILHKIQSPSEVEALFALDVLKTCVETCGKSFQHEIGKFRFLNELIKVLSPKYLGNQTSDIVKKRVTELFYLWTYTLPDEPKVLEAYKLLRKQGLIKEEPRFLLKSDSDSYSIKKRPKSIFDDEEKTRHIAALLKSRNPDDIIEANRLIKHLAFEDEINTERLMKRKYELQRIRTNATLLAEMIENYDPSNTSKETLEVLFHELVNFTPLIHRLATETDDNDEGIGDILEVNDLTYRVIQQYKDLASTFSNETSDSNSGHLIDLEKPGMAYATVSSESCCAIEATKAEMSVDEMLIDIFTPKDHDRRADKKEETYPSFAQSDVLLKTKQITSVIPDNEVVSSPSELSAYNENAEVVPQDVNTGPVPYDAAENPKGFDFLNEITNLMSAQLLLKSEADKTKDNVQGGTDVNPVSDKSSSLSENVLSSSDDDLTKISINVAKFIPSTNPPIEIFQRSGLKILAYQSKDHPADLIYSFLFTAINSGEEHIKNLSISLIPSKNVFVKNERPSSTELFPFNPVIPPSCLTQGFLIKVHSKMDTKVKVKISYISDDDQISDVKEIILKY